MQCVVVNERRLLPPFLEALLPKALLSALAEAVPEGLLPEELFRRVQARFAEQLRSAREWRDIINSWFCRRSGIPDAHGREIY